MIQLWRTNKVRTFLYAPENEPYLRTTLQRIWGNAPDFDQFEATECFVQSSTPDNFDSEPQDLSWVLNKAVVAIKRDETGLVVIDPWNELEHAKPREVMMTDYIRTA